MNPENDLSKQHLTNIAYNRFGLGVKYDDVNLVLDDAKAYLKQQLTPVMYANKLEESSTLLLQLHDFNIQKRKLSQKGEKVKGPSFYQKHYIEASVDGLNSAIESDNSISWRLLDFFSNHFSVTAQGPQMMLLAPMLEREAIGPNLFGKFEQLLLAVIQHPAMLIYLNNQQSFGPNSKLAKKGKGLNENLAREILELHTLGVNSGYSQQDVIELAKGISGWSLANPKRDNKAGFMFKANGHEPGARHLLGVKYKQQGQSQGLAMLTDLARHPATAKHVCYKMARHFISDNPPQTLIDKLVKRWQTTQGNIHLVMLELIEAQESWQKTPSKFKTPREYLVSVYRLTNQQPKNKRAMLKSLSMLGQTPFKANSPAGFADTEANWNAASGIISRINWSSKVAASVNNKMAKMLLSNLSQFDFAEMTYKAISRAESRQDAITLLLMSPEFLRR